MAPLTHGPLLMRTLRALAILLLVATLATAAYLTLRGFSLVGAPELARVKDVPAGHQEIAFLAPASAVDAWERLVSALDALEREWPTVYPKLPALRIKKDNPFAQLTTDVAEIAICLDGCATE